MAAFVGQPVWAAAAGAGLVLVYWALEVLTWRRARDRQDLAARGRPRAAWSCASLVVLAGLVVIGVLDRPAFPTAALSFLAAFTLYIVVRPITYPTASTPAGQARLQ